MPDPIQGVLKRPFAAQVAFFRQKLGNLIPTERWDEVLKSAHDNGFMVAGAAKADLLADLAAAVDRAVSEGGSIGAFRKDFDQIVERHGWSYRGEYNWRTRTIYRTNMATSYSAGRLAQLKEAELPYWIYRHSDSVARPRPLHVSWDGMALPANDPWWDTHYPPNGWGCMCYVVGARSERGVSRLGGKIGNAPNDGTELDGRSKGIDKGWDYQPGSTVAGSVKAAASKTVQWDYSLAKAYMDNVPSELRDVLARAQRSLPETGANARRYAERAIGARNGAPIGKLIEVQQYRTLGLATSKDSAKIKDLTGIEADGFDWAIDRDAVRHIHRVHGGARETLRGQLAVIPDDYAKITSILDFPDAVEAAGETGVGRQAVRYIKDIDGVRYVTVFEVRTNRKMMVLQSMWKRLAPVAERP